MAVTLTKSFSDYDVANQKLIYTGTTSLSPVPSDFLFRVRIYELTGWNTSSQIAEMYLPLNPGGATHVDISPFVKPRIDERVYSSNLAIHVPSTILTRATNGIKRYRVEFAEWTNNTIGGSASNSNNFLIDGANQISQGYAPGFDTHEASSLNAQAFLSSRYGGSRLEVRATRDDEGVVAFINDSNVWASDADQIKYEVTTSSGSSTTTTFDINTTNGSGLPSNSLISTKLTYAGLLPGTISGNVTLGDWSYYDVYLYDSVLATRVSKIYRVTRDCPTQKHKTTQIAFQNALGGWDYLLFEGRVEYSVESEGKKYRKVVGTYGGATFSFSNVDRELAMFGTTATKKYKVSSVLFTESDHRLMDELFRSKSVMAKLDRDWLPVILDTTSGSYRMETSSKIKEVTVEFTLAQKIQC